MLPILIPLLAHAAPAFGAYSLIQILVVAIVLITVFYIFNQVVNLPAPYGTILNAVLIAVVAIMAIYFLASFL